MSRDVCWDKWTVGSQLVQTTWNGRSLQTVRVGAVTDHVQATPQPTTAIPLEPLRTFWWSLCTMLQGPSSFSSDGQLTRPRRPPRSSGSESDGSLRAYDGAQQEVRMEDVQPEKLLA